MGTYGGDTLALQCGGVADESLAAGSCFFSSSRIKRFAHHHEGVGHGLGPIRE